MMQLQHQLLFSTMVILGLVTSARSSGCGKCGMLYTAVNQTESIEEISLFCNVPVESLLQQNPPYNASSVLSAGDILNIRCSGRDSIDCGPCGVRYVSSGDENASVIADKCGIPAVVLGPWPLTEREQVVSIPCNVKSLQRKTKFRCGICGSVINVTGTVPLDRIAVACNVDASAVQALNPAQASMVTGGTQIYIPCLGQGPVCGPCGHSYRVRPGDIYYKTAILCDLPLRDLLIANPQAPDAAKLSPGDLLHIPCDLDQSRRTSGKLQLCGLHVSGFWWLRLTLAIVVVVLVQSLK